MATTVGDIKEYVRAFLEMEPDDLPDLLLVRWLSEGDLAIRKRIRQWSFLETSFTLTTVVGQADYPLASLGVEGLREVTRLEHPTWGALAARGARTARDSHFTFGPAVDGTPFEWSVWADTVTLHPTPDEAVVLQGLGIRKASNDWKSLGDGSVPDLPEDLIEILFSWVLYKAFLWSDDTELAAAHKANYDEAIRRYEAFDQQAPADRLIQLNGDALRCGGADYGSLPWCGV